MDGVFPTTRIGGRLFVRRADLPAVATALGVAPKPATKKRGKPALDSAAA